MEKGEQKNIELREQKTYNKMVGLNPTIMISNVNGLNAPIKERDDQIRF